MQGWAHEPDVHHPRYSAADIGLGPSFERATGNPDQPITSVCMHQLSHTAPTAELDNHPEVEKQALVLGVSLQELRHYKRLFMRFDRHGTGEIDVNELGALLSAAGVPCSPEELLELIQEYDADGSGNIDFDEFLGLIVALGGNSGGTNWIQSLCSGIQEDIDMHAKSSETRQKVHDALECPRTLPDSRTKTVSEFLCLAGTMYFAGVIGAEDTVADVDEYTGSAAALAVEVALSLALVADVVLMFDTALMHHQKLVADRHSVVMHYLRGWFVADLLSSLPLDLVVRAALGEAHRSSATYFILRHLRLLRIARIPSLFRLCNRGLMSSGYVSWHFIFVPWIRRSAFVCLGLHWLAVAWIGMHGADYGYVRALYWVMYTVTTVGYGDVDVDTDKARLFSCALFLLGACAQGVIIGYVTNYVMRSDIGALRDEKMCMTAATLRHFSVTPGLQEEILAFQQHILQNNLGDAHNDVFSGLPAAMTEQLSVYVRLRLIAPVPIFSSCDQSTRCALATALKNITVPPAEVIILLGELGSEMFFLSHGFAEVTSGDGKWLATIPKGGFFGEIALLMETERSANIRALTFCDLFVLRKLEFDTICAAFPEFAEQMAREAENRRGQREISAHLAGSLRVLPPAYPPENPLDASLQHHGSARTGFGQTHQTNQTRDNQPLIDVRGQTVSDNGTGAEWSAVGAKTVSSAHQTAPRRNSSSNRIDRNAVTPVGHHSDASLHGDDLPLEQQTSSSCVVSSPRTVAAKSAALKPKTQGSVKALKSSLNDPNESGRIRGWAVDPATPASITERERAVTSSPVAKCSSPVAKRERGHNPRRAPRPAPLPDGVVSLSPSGGTAGGHPSMKSSQHGSPSRPRSPNSPHSDRAELEVPQPLSPAATSGFGVACSSGRCSPDSQGSTPSPMHKRAGSPVVSQNTQPAQDSDNLRPTPRGGHSGIIRGQQGGSQISQIRQVLRTPRGRGKGAFPGSRPSVAFALTAKDHRNLGDRRKSVASALSRARASVAVPRTPLRARKQTTVLDVGNSTVFNATTTTAFNTTTASVNGCEHDPRKDSWMGMPEIPDHTAVAAAPDVGHVVRSAVERAVAPLLSQQRALAARFDKIDAKVGRMDGKLDRVLVTQRDHTSALRDVAERTSAVSRANSAMMHNSPDASPAVSPHGAHKHPDGTHAPASRLNMMLQTKDGSEEIRPPQKVLSFRSRPGGAAAAGSNPKIAVTADHGGPRTPREMMS